MNTNDQVALQVGLDLLRSLRVKSRMPSVDAQGRPQYTIEVHPVPAGRRFNGWLQDKAITPEMDAALVIGQPLLDDATHARICDCLGLSGNQQQQSALVDQTGQALTAGAGMHPRTAGGPSP